MRIVFMGTPEFAVPSLKILLDNAYSVVSVVTVPDRPTGRGQRVSPSPVKEFSVSHDLPLLQPETLTDENFVRRISALQPDLIVVVAFRILPAVVFTIPPLGAFNLHASLLPRYRGAAPIQWAIMNGETETGVTSFFLREKVDTGNIILQARVPIREDATSGELHDTLSGVGAEIVLHTVRLIEAGRARPTEQDNKLATPAPKITKEDCLIDWRMEGRVLVNRIRGLSPRPAAFTTLAGSVMKIHRARLESPEGAGQPGAILRADGPLLVQAGKGVVEILELQHEGKKVMSTAEFLRGHRIPANSHFG